MPMRARVSSRSGSSARCQLTDPAGFCAHVQFKTLRYQDDGLGAVFTLPLREFEGLSSVNKQTAAQPAGVLDDPVSAAVFADQEGSERWAARRGRFTFAHGIDPFAAQARAMISSAAQSPLFGA
jgi:hypothetical protein